MPKAIAENPASRSSWQWEKLKAHLEEEYYNPAKFHANCKVKQLYIALAVRPSDQHTAGLLIIPGIS